jgi:hypothetical protein
MEPEPPLFSPGCFFCVCNARTSALLPLYNNAPALRTRIKEPLAISIQDQIAITPIADRDNNNSAFFDAPQRIQPQREKGDRHSTW